MASEIDDSVNEQSLALAWNIPRSALATVRKSRLREHWHWKTGPSKNRGDIRFTKEGIEELKRWVVPPDKPVPVPPPETVMEPVKSGEIPPDNSDIVVVWRVPPNPRMLQCKDHRGGYVSVRVRSNVRFRAGMKIDVATQCVRLYSRGGIPPEYYVVYAFKGKYPRAYGRW